jgi:hypothetical protein
MPCFLSEDDEKGLEDFRLLNPHTTDEELVLLVNNDQFRTIKSGMAQYLESISDSMRTVVNGRLALAATEEFPTIGSITSNDKYQFNGAETPRSLENVLTNGINISVDPMGLEQLRLAYEQASDGILPVTELVKNQQILGVNGFMSSKISLAVHDAVDHTWTFAMLKRNGYLDKYHGLFDSVGNPETTDIFKREGEMVASIAFGVRYWATVENGFEPFISSSKMLGHMDDLFDKDKLHPLHMSAYKILRELGRSPNSREAQSLGFNYSNYVIELNEQRRKYGKIKQRDPQSKRVIGELDPLGPDYLSLFVETHHELLNSDNKHRNELLRFHILLEEFLCANGSGRLGPEDSLQLKAQDMAKIDLSKTTLPPSRIQWMSRNYGFSAIRDSIL